MTQLNDPLRLSAHYSLPNRIVKAAMSEKLADAEGAPTVGLVRLYEKWAESGAGLLLTGNVMLDHNAIAEAGNVVIKDDRHLDALRAWAQAGKSHGAHMWLQLNHPGRQIPRTLSREPVAPSAVPVKMSGLFAAPRALESAEIEAIIEDFARAAAVSEAAGFDGVEIHGAHGYLINQFLSPHTNLREDEWGGTPEKRRRFLLEVIAAVRAAVSPAFAVGLKLNSADFQRGGFDADESMNVVAALADVGLDLLEISGGTYESAVMFAESPPKHESSRRREAYFMEYAERVRDKTALPLMVTGGFRTRAGMNDALASGATDLIGIGRPLVVEPDLPRRLLSGDAEQATPVKLATGNKQLDAIIQGSWHAAQFSRMARGRDPKPSLSRWTSLVRYFLPPRRFPRATLAQPDAPGATPAASAA